MQAPLHRSGLRALGLRTQDAKPPPPLRVQDVGPLHHSGLRTWAPLHCSGRRKQASSTAQDSGHTIILIILLSLLS